CARKGTGSPCLESFISAMKAYGFRRIRLDAYPSAYSMGDAPPGAVERLVHWYERFGFRLNGEFTPDYFNGMSLPL
ncbi:MAG: hypothetical protein PHV57_10110, partial [Methanomicrobiaceae archaeon]|nr:hypothetical protein [Methanomicrobiaceae archaeon]